MTGSLSHSPAQIVSQYLRDQSLAAEPGISSTWPVYVGTLPDQPDDCVMSSDQAGTHDGRTSPDLQAQLHYGVQLLVRSKDRTDGWVKLTAIAVALDAVHMALVNIGSSYYRIRCITRAGTMLYAGFDEVSKRRYHSLNVLVSVVATP